MKQYLLGLLLLLSSSISHAETKATIGGLISSNDTANLTLGFDHTVENGPWQSVIETDYFFSEQKNIVSRNRGFFSGKQNYSLDERNYVFVVGRYEFDKLRTPDEKVIAGAGYGYKLIRTSKVKLSNEVSLGTLKDRYDFEPVVRNSIWLTYNVDSKLTFTNKFLIEQGTDTYIRNKTGLDYALSDTLIVGMSNLYVHDLADDNIFTFNIGVKFK
jgi:putative salt-induced outer membrane protein YdiY